MRQVSKLPRLAAVIALVMALLAFVLGAAPFTPALVLTVIALPVAIVCAALGVWRLSALAAYWSATALLVVPLSRVMALRLDATLLGLGIAGLLLTVILLRNYRQHTHRP